MNAKILFLSSLLCLASCKQEAQNISEENEKLSMNILPLEIHRDSVKHLRNLIDAELQSKLQEEIYKNAKWKRLIVQKKNGNWCCRS